MCVCLQGVHIYWCEIKPRIQITCHSLVAHSLLLKIWSGFLSMLIFWGSILKLTKGCVNHLFGVAVGNERSLGWKIRKYILRFSLRLSDAKQTSCEKSCNNLSKLGMCLTYDACISMSLKWFLCLFKRYFMRRCGCERCISKWSSILIICLSTSLMCPISDIYDPLIDQRWNFYNNKHLRPFCK